jgi:oligopeptide transport system permease protein
VTFSGQSVNDVLARTLPVTGRLAVMAIAIEFTLAIIIGTISALRKGKLFDNTCSWSR